MVANGTDELRSQMGKARGSLARARSGDEVVAVDEAVLRVVP
jgi:hypothetical protein